MKNLPNRELRALLRHMGACKPALKWLGKRDLRQALTECPNDNWLLWFMDVSSFERSEWAVTGDPMVKLFEGLPDYDTYTRTETEAFLKLRQDMRKAGDIRDVRLSLMGTDGRAEVEAEATRMFIAAEAEYLATLKTYLLAQIED